MHRRLALALVWLAACGDSRADAETECKAQPARCDNGVATSCVVACDGDDCTAETQSLHCGSGTGCHARTLTTGEPEVALCLVVPSTDCDASFITRCRGDGAADVCNTTAGSLERYDCTTSPDAPGCDICTP